MNQLIDQKRCINNTRFKFLYIICIFRKDILCIKKCFICIKIFFKKNIFFLRKFAQTGPELFLVQQISNPDSRSSCFILISRTYSATGCANFRFSFFLFTQLVKYFMPRHHKLRSITDVKMFLYINAHFFQIIYFLNQFRQIDHHTISQD